MLERTVTIAGRQSTIYHMMDLSAWPTDFQTLLRNALNAQTSFRNASTQLLHIAGSKDPEQDNPKFRPVVDGIHFSLAFILSYQLVLIGLLSFCTTSHWFRRWRAWRRRRNARLEARTARVHVQEIVSEDGKNDAAVENRSLGSSSSSSTLAGGSTHKDKVLSCQDERSPLLSKPRSIRHTREWRFGGQVKAFLAYQPSPIPIVNQPLPSNSTILAVLAFLSLQSFYTFYNIPLNLRMLFVIADRTSLVFVANLPLLYLFAAKNQPIKLLTGFSYESLNIVHRTLGAFICLLALLHSAGMIGVWYTLLRPGGVTLVRFLLIKMILLGIGALVAYETIYFTSLGFFRDRWYEIFLGLHVVLQAAALALLWFHHRRSRWYVGTALAIFLIDRLVYRMKMKIVIMRALLEIKEDKQTVVVRTVIGGNQHLSLAAQIFGSDITKGWKATDHVFLTVPSLARNHILQAHPFTIASKAPSAGKATELELLIRAQKGFSNDLVLYAHDHYAVDVKLDGPYGSQSAVRLLRDSDDVAIIAGGSGIAVAWPLVWAVIEDLKIDDLESCPSNKKTKRILFIWIVREHSHLSWLGQDRLKTLTDHGVDVVIPPPTAIAGHPDAASLLHDWIAEVDSQNLVSSKIGVVASGPNGMNRTIRNTCASSMWEGHDVSIEIEKYGW